MNYITPEQQARRYNELHRSKARKPRQYTTYRNGRSYKRPGRRDFWMQFLSDIAPLLGFIVIIICALAAGAVTGQ
jgi:hypothetical protein